MMYKKHAQGCDPLAFNNHMHLLIKGFVNGEVKAEAPNGLNGFCLVSATLHR